MEIPGSVALTTEIEKNKRAMNDFTIRREYNGTEISHGKAS